MKRRHLTRVRILELISKLRQRSIFDLHKKRDSEDAERLLKETKYRKLGVHLYGVLDYRAYYTLGGEQRRELYYVFVDFKNATEKTRMCAYLREKKITSLNLAGDMDIVAILLTTRGGLLEFTGDIAGMFPRCEIHTYSLLRPLFIEGFHPRSKAPDISEIKLPPCTISRIQANYADKTLKNERARMTAERVLIGYSVQYDFVELGELRDVALVFGVPKVNEHLFRKVPEIAEHIIDLYEVDYERPEGFGAERDYTTFYSGADYLAVLEYNKSSEREIWEKMVGTVFPNSNVFFFPVSAIVFPGPYGITDIEFDNRCRQYAPKDMLPLGRPVRNGGETDCIVGMSANSVNKNGCILGQPRHGKTTTALRLVEGFAGQKWTVHVLNPTADLLEELKKGFGRAVQIHQMANLSSAKKGLADFGGGIHVFLLDKRAGDEAHSNALISAITRTPEVKPVPVKYSTVKTKDNPVNFVLVIDEAHELTAGPHADKVLRRVASVLEKVSHHGIAVYFISPRVSDLGEGEDSLIPLLGNRIFHRMLERESNVAKDLLLPSGATADSMYGRLEGVLHGLPVGRALVRFTTQDGEALPPLKVQVLRKKQ